VFTVTNSNLSTIYHDYQTYWGRENAPPCLTVAHFDEFADDKGRVARIVLQDEETMHYLTI
jgi:hypothetical protein